MEKATKGITIKKLLKALKGIDRTYNAHFQLIKFRRFATLGDEASAWKTALDDWRWFENKGICTKSDLLKHTSTAWDWHENDTLRKETLYRDGELDGLQQEWHTNGQLYYQETYVGGKRHGLSLRWDESGQLRHKNIYRDGKLDGLQQNWHANGHLSGECTFENGKLQGLYRTWHSDGPLRGKAVYEGLELGYNTQWDTNGLPVVK